MAAFNAALLTAVSLGASSIDDIRKEASLVEPGGTGPLFVCYLVDLAAIAGGAAVDDVISAPGAGRSLFIVDIQIGARVGTSPAMSVALVYGATYEFTLASYNIIVGAGNDPNAAQEVMQKLPANLKFGIKNLSPTNAANHTCKVRFAVV